MILMNDNYGFICPSLHSSLVGKVVKYNENRGYLLKMPKEKNSDDDVFYYCNVDLKDYIDKWVEIKVEKYTDYGVKYDIKKITKTQAKDRC